MCQEIPRAIQLSPNASSNACSTPTRPLWRCYNKLEGPVQRPCTEVSLTQGNTQSSPLRSRICPGIKSTMEQILTYLLHWWRHCTCCLQCKTDVTCTFFSTNKVTSPALIFIGADLKSTNSPQRFFHLKINLLHRLQSSQKTWFSSLWQIQLPPDIWYIPSPMISAFSIGGHHVPQCKGLIQNTNVRSTGWATVFLGIFWLYQPENTVKYTQYKDWKQFWPYSES